MGKRPGLKAVLLALLVVSLLVNSWMLLKLRSLSVGHASVEFYGAVGTNKVVGVMTGPLMTKMFGENWDEQRIYMRTDQAGSSLYHGNFSLVPAGTFPVVFSLEGYPGQYTLYSADRKLLAGVTVDFIRKSVKWHVPKDQPTWHETFLPDGELKLGNKSPTNRDIPKALP